MMSEELVVNNNCGDTSTAGDLFVPFSREKTPDVVFFSDDGHLFSSSLWSMMAK